MKSLLILAALVLVAGSALADISDSGNLSLGNQAVVQGTMTVVGSGLSLGSSTMTASGGNLGIGTTSPATTLDVNGSAQFGSGVTKSTFSSTGALNLSNNAALTLSGGSGNIISASSVTASAFFGDGSHLTGVNPTGNAVLTATQTFSGANTFTSSTTFKGQVSTAFSPSLGFWNVVSSQSVSNVTCSTFTALSSSTSYRIEWEAEQVGATGGTSIGYMAIAFNGDSVFGSQTTYWSAIFGYDPDWGYSSSGFTGGAYILMDTTGNTINADNNEPLFGEFRFATVPGFPHKVAGFGNSMEWGDGNYAKRSISAGRYNGSANLSQISLCIRARTGPAQYSGNVYLYANGFP